MCEACNREILVDLGRQVDNCERHGDSWCSCKVRQYLSLIGLFQFDDEGEEVRYLTDWFPKGTINHSVQE